MSTRLERMIEEMPEGEMKIKLNALSQAMMRLSCEWIQATNDELIQDKSFWDAMCKVWEVWNEGYVSPVDSGPTMIDVAAHDPKQGEISLEAMGLMDQIPLEMLDKIRDGEELEAGEQEWLDSFMDPRDAGF